MNEAKVLLPCGSIDITATSKKSKFLKAGIASLLGLILLSGCVAHKQYRNDYTPCISASPLTDCQSSSIQEYRDAELTDQHYILGFVELDDKGQLWDRAQMHRLLDRVASESARQDVLMVVFVHGWKHSAKAGDENIKSFRRTLQRLSAMESQLAVRAEIAPRKVVGVYLGWRGASISTPLVNNVTFWDRKNTAHAVGYGDTTEVLSRLQLLKKTKVEMDRQDEKQSRTRLVVIGHSFGGAVVYSAVAEILENAFIQTQGPAAVTSNSIGFSDLVVLINPAFEALRHSSLSDMSTERGTYFESQLPVIAVLTSEADLATKLAFPAGRLISTVFEKGRIVERHNPVINDTQSIDQNASNVTALGHFAPYRTHYLRALEKRRGDYQEEFDLSSEVQTYFAVGDSWKNDKPGSQINFTGAVLERGLDSAGRNPYMNILVDRELIENHNDLEDPRIGSFIRQLILLSSTDMRTKPNSESKSAALTP